LRRSKPTNSKFGARNRAVFLLYAILSPTRRRGSGFEANFPIFFDFFASNRSFALADAARRVKLGKTAKLYGRQRFSRSFFVLRAPRFSPLFVEHHKKKRRARQDEFRPSRKNEPYFFDISRSFAKRRPQKFPA
jgi:hypothetical protein